MQAYFDGPWPKYALAFIIGLAAGGFTEHGEFWSDVKSLATMALTCSVIIMGRKIAGDCRRCSSA